VEAGAEVAAGEGPEPVDVLLRERAIEAELRAEPRLLLLHIGQLLRVEPGLSRPEAARERELHRIAGRQPHDQEPDERDGDEGRNEQRDAPRGVREQRHAHQWYFCSCSGTHHSASFTTPLGYQTTFLKRLS